MNSYHWGLTLISIAWSIFRLSIIPIFKCKGERKIWWQLLKLTLFIAAGSGLLLEIIVTATVERNAGREREHTTKTLNRERACKENKGMGKRESGIRSLQFKGEDNNLVLKFLFTSLASSNISCPKRRKQRKSIRIPLIQKSFPRPEMYYS